MAKESPFRIIRGGLKVAVRVTPNAGSDRIEGLERRSDGSIVLHVKVRAVPDKGKANAALLALLASAFGVPRARLSLASGATARTKAILVSGDPAELAARAATICPA